MALLLLLGTTLSSCADEDFFQEDAHIKKAAPADSVWVTAGRHYTSGWLHRLFWGDHYRQVWAEPVKVPVFNMQQLNGGLYLTEKGGGFQTTSFELEDSLGRRYALRSLDKDPVHVLYDFWKPTFVTNVLRDQTSASNPYGALVVPILAEAVGVYHTNPTLYYVAKTDTSLGEYSKLAQGKVFILEEKYKSTADRKPTMANVLDFNSSDDALNLRYNTNTHHFNQKAFARARLLDVFLGDWDRHKGQWDWAIVKQGTETYFEPIPKDRDQVFLKMDDGVVPFIATSRFMARKLQTFNNEFSDVKALMINARFIDERLLNELTAADWKQIAKQMQTALSDEVIERAVLQLPPPVYKLVGKEITDKLKSRRDLLPDAAEEMYKLLAEEVTIAGSDMQEEFKINRLDDKRVEVTVTRPASPQAPAYQIYHRNFYTSETELLILHGLAADDTFVVEGTVKKSIPVKIYGGLGEDAITDNSDVAGRRKMTEVYDTERGTILNLGTEARNRTTRDVRVHAYDREGN
ncbi:hypothetical protein H8S95_04325 [Pontibacter sp. KCTC 32443]|uniref:hypothetical protein n=1 Tax=Pontibacter TaxID=323449 RepID=UPI00164D61A0|nr:MULTISPECIES: hypothetical protein [Pontibacter]MBC5773281.1 hypothetical protein [Pontibacter sp. KCTC 32443]